MYGGNQDLESLEKKLVQRRKIIDACNLKDLQYYRKLKPPASLIDKVLASIFYGFNTNLGYYTGSGKKYFVKFSDYKGSIAKSIFDLNNQYPELIIYNEFVADRDMQKENLSIISELSISTILLFISLEELKKKIKD